MTIVVFVPIINYFSWATINKKPLIKITKPRARKTVEMIEDKIKAFEEKKDAWNKLNEEENIEV